MNENAEVSVSRVWLRNAQTERQAHSLSYDIKPPKVKPEYTKPSTELKSSNKTTVSPSKSEKVNINSIEDDEYEPPPLFASDSGVQNY